jgi:hypothetical protein
MFGLMVNGFGAVENMFTQMGTGHLHAPVMYGLQAVGLKKDMVGTGKEVTGDNKQIIHASKS